jgi:hypothetical protein
VYAVFESKQTISSEIVRYARQKAASVRNLHRTSLAIPHASGKFEAKAPGPILTGILSFESNWNPALGEPLKTALEGGEQLDGLDIGCIAAHRRHPVLGLAAHSFRIKNAEKPHQSRSRKALSIG